SNVVFETVGVSTWTGADDQTSTFSISWDSNNLYIAVSVVDDYHNNVFGGPEDGDSVRLLFANQARTAITHLYSYSAGGDDEFGVGNLVTVNEQGPGGTVAAFIRDKDKHKT